MRPSLAFRELPATRSFPFFFIVYFSVLCHFVEFQCADLRMTALCYRPRKIFRSLRRHQRRQLPEMRRQGAQAGQEEEDQARDQDSPESLRRPQHRRLARRRTRLAEQNPITHLRVRQQYRLPEPLPQIQRHRRAVLHLRAPQGPRLLPQQGHYAPRCEAS